MGIIKKLFNTMLLSIMIIRNVILKYFDVSCFRHFLYNHRSNKR